MSINTRRAIGAFLLLSVGVTGIITILRHYSRAYMLVDPSEEYALIAAAMTVGCVLLLGMLPNTAIKGAAFIAVTLALVAAGASASAPRLGLIDTAPMAWRYALLAVVTFPIAAVMGLFWSIAPKAKMTERESESGESKRKLSVKTERAGISVRTPQAIGERKQKELANPDNPESAELSAAEMSTLLETLTEFVDAGGNRAEAARRLKITPPGVSDRLHRLYKVDPDIVTRQAPQWVNRNIFK